MSDFSDNIVNQRFKLAFEMLETYNMVKSKSDLAEKLGTYNHVVNNILKGQRNITVDQLHKLFEVYRLNANYFFGLSEELFMGGAPELGALPTRLLSERLASGRQNITLVPARALAGYAVSPGDEAFMESLQKFSIPGLEGTLTAFEISGDSMMPTVTNGDMVVCEVLERDSPLRDNHVYVVVSDVVVAKRIQQVREGNQVVRLRLISDNDAVYKPYDIELEEVAQILKVKARLTAYAIS